MSNYTQNSLVADSNHAWTILYNLIPEKATVLDVGCSSGNFGKELIGRKDCVVDGIELDPIDSKVAAKKLRTVWTLNIETDSLDAISERYDYIILADVIEHLVQPATALRRIKSLLKPNGRLVFSVPNMAHLSVRLALLAGKFTYTETGVLDKTHLHYYDYEELQRVLHDGGLSIDHIDYPQIRYPQSLIDQKLRVLGLKASKQFYEHLNQPELYAYQFIGSATYTTDKPKVKPLTAKQAIQNDFLQMSNQIKFVSNELLAVKQVLSDTQRDLAATNQSLTAIQGSKAYRLARSSGNAAHNILNKLRPKSGK